jgi:hypothetical protein
MDAESSESIVRTDYALISGRASEKRDWTRWKALLAPGARMIPIESVDGGPRKPNVMTPDEYIASRSPWLAREDFYEWETAREELRCGQLVHVWSSYEAAHEPNGKLIRKGVNSIQLWNDGTRYWILSVAWDAVEALEAVS